MKLNSAQMRSVENQLGVAALPEDHPAAPNLEEAFGEHTFFLDADGLNIVETEHSSDRGTGNITKLASWTNEERDKLRKHEPEVLTVTVELERDSSD